MAPLTKAEAMEKLDQAADKAIKSLLLEVNCPTNPSLTMLLKAAYIQGFSFGIDFSKGLIKL